MNETTKQSVSLRLRVLYTQLLRSDQTKPIQSPDCRARRSRFHHCPPLGASISFCSEYRVASYGRRPPTQLVKLDEDGTSYTPPQELGDGTDPFTFT